MESISSLPLRPANILLFDIPVLGVFFLYLDIIIIMTFLLSYFAVYSKKKIYSILEIIFGTIMMLNFIMFRFIGPYFMVALLPLFGFGLFMCIIVSIGFIIIGISQLK